MRAVHYFPRYSQAENVVTNNALLMLMRLHEFSRFKFEKFIEEMCADADVDFIPQWLRFGQQVGNGASVVDGFIAQDSVKIVIETKLKGTFSADQLERHFNAFENEKHKLLILLSPTLGKTAASQLVTVQEIATVKGICALHTSFEELIARIRKLLSPHDEAMRALVEDFEDFCSAMELLPTDQYTLFAPPCGKTFPDNEKYRLYYCPSDWSRRNARFLGIYAKKTVLAIGKVAKVVDCSIDLAAESITLADGETDLDADERARILAVAKNAPEHGWNISSGHKFYLCSDWASTDFRKDSHGGIMGHRYFDLRQILGKTFIFDVQQIALELKKHTWK